MILSTRNADADRDVVASFAPERDVRLRPDLDAPLDHCVLINHHGDRAPLVRSIIALSWFQREGVPGHGGDAPGNRLYLLRLCGIDALSGIGQTLLPRTNCGTSQLAKSKRGDQHHGSLECAHVDLRRHPLLSMHAAFRRTDIPGAKLQSRAARVRKFPAGGGLRVGIRDHWRKLGKFFRCTLHFYNDRTDSTRGAQLLCCSALYKDVESGQVNGVLGSVFRAGNEGALIAVLKTGAQFSAARNGQPWVPASRLFFRKTAGGYEKY